MMNQIWVMEELILTLKEEQMQDAVISISNEMYELGVKMENSRMQVFSLLILGELISQESINDEKKAEDALTKLLKATEMYNQDAKILSGEEYSRVCLALSTLFRQHRKDFANAKMYLESAKDKATDKRVLLQFYQENAFVL